MWNLRTSSRCPTTSHIALLALVFPLQTVAITFLDNTLGLTVTPTGSNNSAGVAFYSTSLYGYSFVTGAAGFSLQRLDVSLNLVTSGPFVVDFVVSVWTPTDATTGFTMPIYSAHAS